MESYLKIPIFELEEVFDINTKLNILNNQLHNQVYNNYSFNFLHDDDEYDNDYTKSDYSENNNNKNNSKSSIRKAIFYMKIPDKNNIVINNSTNNSNNIIEYNILNCPICYNTILNKNNYTNLQCNHVFCSECYDSWDNTCVSNNIDTSCPLCRGI